MWLLRRAASCFARGKISSAAAFSANSYRIHRDATRPVLRRNNTRVIHRVHYTKLWRHSFRSPSPAVKRCRNSGRRRKFSKASTMMAGTSHSEQTLMGIGCWSSNYTARKTANVDCINHHPPLATSYSALLDELVRLTPGSMQQRYSTSGSLSEHVEAEGLQKELSMLERHLDQNRARGQYSWVSKRHHGRQKRRRDEDKKGK